MKRFLLILIILIGMPFFSGCTYLDSMTLEHIRRYHQEIFSLYYTDDSLNHVDPESILENFQKNPPQNSSERNNQIVALIKTGDTEKAKILLNNLLQEKPTIIEPYLNLSGLAAQEKKWNIVKSVLGEFAAQTWVADKKLEEIVSGLELGRRLPEAAILREAMLNGNRNSLESALWLARTSLKESRLSIARNYYLDVYRLEPGHEESVFALGFIAYQNQEYTDALYYFYAAGLSGSQRHGLCEYITESLHAGGKPGPTLSRLMIHRFQSSPLFAGRPTSDERAFLDSMKTGLMTPEKFGISEGVEIDTTHSGGLSVKVIGDKKIYSRWIIEELKNNPLDRDNLLMESARSCSIEEGSPEMIRILGEAMLTADFRANLSPLKKLLRKKKIKSGEGLFDRTASNLANVTHPDKSWEILMTGWYGIQDPPLSGPVGIYTDEITIPY